jgi:4-carboxymuconolactone decarboxylase
MLDARTEAIVRASMLASRPSYRDELRQHLTSVKADALASREELYEAFLQLYLFAGFPAALEACRALLRLLPIDKSEVNGDLASYYNVESFARQGEELYKKVYATNHNVVKQGLIDISPELAAWALVEGYGKTLSRPNLDTKTRELAIVAILTQLEWDRQLFSHILGSRNVGATSHEIAEAARIGANGDAKKFEIAEQLIRKIT